MNKKLNIQKMVANPGDQKHYDGKRWILRFGASGCINVLVYSDHLQNALDECADWIEEHAPGLFCDDEIADAYAARFFEVAVEHKLTADELREDNALHSSVMEYAEVDTTAIGGSGQHITSAEWCCIEDPTREDLARIFEV